jgi:hypothetical protein
MMPPATLPSTAWQTSASSSFANIITSDI